MRKKSWCPVLGVAVLGVFLCGGILPAQGTPPAGKPAARGRRSIPQVRAARAMEQAVAAYNTVHYLGIPEGDQALAVEGFRTSRIS